MIRLTMQCLRIPFRTAFKHASATRSETQSLWVEAQASDGTIGYGESCPREYVTGESIQSAATFFAAQHDRLLKEVKDLHSLRAWTDLHRKEIDQDPAAWCAIELALLDLFAKQAGGSIEQYLSLPELSGDFRYTAVLGDSDAETFQRQVAKYRAVGFSDFKVKIAGNLDSDRAKLVALSPANAAHIRLDANNLWSDASAAIDYLKQLGASFFAVEEPIRAGDYDGMCEIAKILGVKIILDESFARIEQLEALPASPGIWIINLRVSKMGGLLRSLGIVKRAREIGVPIIIGAQVGESSLLTRAALPVAAETKDMLLGQEGAFGTLLLSADVCTPSLMFGAGGVLTAQPSAIPGFGLAIARPGTYLSPIDEGDRHGNGA